MGLFKTGWDELGTPATPLPIIPLRLATHTLPVGKILDGHQKSRVR